MQAKRAAIVAGIFMIAIGLVGIAVGPSTITALAQGAPPSGGGMGMMGGMSMMGGPFAASARPITMERAIQILRAWPVAHNFDGLVLDEVEAYTDNYCVRSTVSRRTA